MDEGIKYSWNNISNSNFKTMSKMKLFFILFALLFSFCHKSQNQQVNTISAPTQTNLTKQGYLITIGLSQSNGTCRFTQSGNIAAKYTTTLTNCYVYYKPINNSSDNGSWQQLKAGVNDQQGTAQTGMFGISTFIAFRLDSMYNKSAYVINSSVGGTHIANDVFPGWNSTHVNEYYTGMVHWHFIPAYSKLAGVNVTPVLLIIHGESDSDTQAHANAYYQNMYDAIVKFRQDSGFPNMKVIITKLRTDYYPTYLYSGTVRQAQIDLAANLTGVYLYDTNTSRTPLSTDGQHYNPVVGSFSGAQSAVNMGNDLADLISTF